MNRPPADTLSDIPDFEPERTATTTIVPHGENRSNGEYLPSDEEMESKGYAKEKPVKSPVSGIPIGELVLPIENDPTELLKHRFLCQRMSLLFVGSTGKGKSSFLLQALALWANGRDCFGITPARPLTSIYIQAENDDGDIAQMRDGICKGLNFNESEREIFFKKVLVCTEVERTGKRFCDEVVNVLLESHKPDLVAIDPALSYLGADTKEQMAVGMFLRNYLNPVLYRHNCAAILNHHTNKLNFSDDVEGRDFAYYGSGSAEWANWARAILALETTKNKGVFKLHAAKRGQKLGWKDAENQASYSQHIAHDKDGNICWHSATQDDIDGCSTAGRPASITDKDFLHPLEATSKTTGEWKKSLADDHGVSKTVFFKMRSRLEKEGRVMKMAGNGNWTLITPRDRSKMGLSPVIPK